MNIVKTAVEETEIRIAEITIRGDLEKASSVEDRIANVKINLGVYGMEPDMFKSLVSTSVTFDVKELLPILREDALETLTAMVNEKLNPPVDEEVEENGTENAINEIDDAIQGE